jgi:DNA polymerase I-like protein with 3'-5' exonuclease and polymerase domains
VSDEWSPPKELPDLRCVSTASIDTETNDKGLHAKHGPGWPWRGGYIVGVSVAWRADSGIRSNYFPLRHPDSPNFDREQVIRWLRDLIKSNVRIVTKNGLYDWGWLWADLGIEMPPAGRLEEIDALATMVDENRRQYSLDALCAWRGFPGKDATLLLQGCEALGLIPKRGKKSFKPQAHLWQLPAALVGPYAETDAVRTLELCESLSPVLDREGTREAYRLEIDLLPMVHRMRRRGIRVDISAAEQARDLLLNKRDAVLAQISEKLEASIGMDEINGRKWLISTFDRFGIKYPRTEKGNPSFKRGKRGWMQHSEHWLPPLIATADQLDQYGDNFLQKQILEHVVNGRVYGEIHPHRSDFGGTRSLRFSYSHPPLQQMPKHDEELAPLIRGVFLPEEGEVWASCDYNQQEFRLAVHYAVRKRLRGADAARNRYIDDPRTDMHAYASELTGGTISRQDGKTFNFMTIYGAGLETISLQLKKSLSETKALLTLYNEKMPFISELATASKNAAHREGFFTLFHGARRHFNTWAPGGKLKKGTGGPCDRDEAIRRTRDPTHAWFGQQIWRAETYKALNVLIQSAAAIQTKLWMRACWHEGVIPMLQMHDSLDLSVSSPETAEMVAQLGEEVIKLDVPMKVDVKYGRSWGDAKHTWTELHAETGAHIESVFELSDTPAPTQRESPKLSNDFDSGPDLVPVDDIVITVLNELPEAARARTVEQRATLEVLPWAGETTFISATPTPSSASASASRNGPSLDSFNGFTIARAGFERGKILCPFHEEKTPSCQLYDDGHYHCFGCQAHGWIAEDMADLPAAVLAQAAKADDGQTLERGLALWDDGKPIIGTLAERYLTEARKLDLTALPTNIDDVLRFHPRCPFGNNGARHPCLLALFRDAESDAPAGIHRIGLTPDAKKIKRLTLGRWPAPRAIKLWSATHKLTIGEGVETVLGALRCGAITPPAWAMGPKTDIADFPVLPGVKAITVLVDRGDPAALAGAEACAARYVAAGTPARWLRTVRVKDFNDVVLE